MQEELEPKEDTMERLYDEMLLPKQVVAPLVGIQKKAQEVIKLLKVANIIVEQLQEWAVKYLDALQHFERKDNIFSKIDRAQLRLHHQNYMCLREQPISTIAAYNRLHNGVESLAQKLGMPSIGSAEEIRGREIIFQEIMQYIKQIKQASKHEGLEITKDIILQYAIAIVNAHMKLSWLWNNIQSTPRPY